MKRSKQEKTDQHLSNDLLIGLACIMFLVGTIIGCKTRYQSQKKRLECQAKKKAFQQRRRKLLMNRSLFFTKDVVENILMSFEDCQEHNLPTNDHR
jgi:hypothetical protein